MGAKKTKTANGYILTESFNRHYPQSETFYNRNGQKEGVSRTFFGPDVSSRPAIVKLEEHYKNDVRDGQSTQYYLSGHPEIVKNFINGVQQGEYKEFYFNRAPKINATYVANRPSGVRTYFYEDYPGKVWRTEPLNDKGETNGEVITYYPNGQPKFKVPFVNGKREGTGHHYDMYGNVIEIKRYKDDIPTGRHDVKKDGQTHLSFILNSESITVQDNQIQKGRVEIPVSEVKQMAMELLNVADLEELIQRKKNSQPTLG